MEVASPTPTYEEIRRQRLEENKKRIEELNLTQLSQILRNPSPKPSPIKLGKPKAIRIEIEYVPVRRSNRVASRPTPDYKEVIVDHIERPRRIVYKRPLLDRVYASDEARLYATRKAEEVQSKLEYEFPSFVKPMLHSHVTRGFWLGLPVQFCKLNLPRHDSTVTLLDENGEEYQTIFLAQKTGLSGGWRGFSIAHELIDGDACVFQLVKPIQFKVYIIRASDSTIVDGALDLLNLDVGAKRINAGKQ